MKVFKEEQDFGTTYYLNQDDKYLKIVYGGNLDLYWFFINKKSREENISPYQDVYESMLITKENYTIYQLFERLLREIKTCEIYQPSEVILEPTFFDEFDICDIYDVDPFTLSKEDEISLTNHYRQETADKMNQKIRLSQAYQTLTQNNAITWHSDDEQIEKADIVRITETEEGILLEFTRPNLDSKKERQHLPGTIAIRFSNSGSRYGALAHVFNRMYNNLTEYEPDFHQIHLEELEYQKRLELKKKDK